MSEPVKQALVVFNGPPGAGKDYLASKLKEYLLEMGHGSTLYTFVFKLFDEIRVMYPFWDEVYTRELKDLPCDRLGGKTPRQIVLDHNDKQKGEHGNSYFTDMTAKEVKGIDTPVIIFTDLGYESEVKMLVQQFGKNFVIVHVHRDGCDYRYDNRSFHTVPGQTIRWNNEINKDETILFKYLLEAHIEEALQ